MDYFAYVAAKEGRRSEVKARERPPEPRSTAEPDAIQVEEFDGSTTIVNRIRAAILERMRP